MCCVCVNGDDMVIVCCYCQVVYGFQWDGWDVDDGVVFFVGDFGVGWVKGIQWWMFGMCYQIE